MNTVYKKNCNLGDHDGILVLLLIPRLLHKTEILLGQIRDKFPAVDKIDRAAIMKGHAVERYEFRCRLSCHIYAIQVGNKTINRFLPKKIMSQIVVLTYNSFVIKNFIPYILQLPKNISDNFAPIQPHVEHVQAWNPAESGCRVSRNVGAGKDHRRFHRARETRSVGREYPDRRLGKGRVVLQHDVSPAVCAGEQVQSNAAFGGHREGHSERLWWH